MSKKPRGGSAKMATKSASSGVRKSHVITSVSSGPPVALYRSGTGKIVVGGAEISFYVLDDGSRIADTTVAEATFRFGVERLLQIRGVHELLPSVILAAAKRPMQYRIQEADPPRSCCLAEVLIHLCAAVITVRRTSGLKDDDVGFGSLAEMFLADVAVKSAKVFVDAITGSVMPNYSKEDGLTSSIAQPYYRTYPDEFYDEIYRLRGLGPVTNYGKHPSYFGNLTNNIVYKRFAPGALAALKDVSPRDEASGKHRRKLFQMLSPEKQIEMQEEYLPAVIAIMKECKTFDEFIGRLDEKFPMHRRTIRPGRKK